MGLAIIIIFCLAMTVAGALGGYSVFIDGGGISYVVAAVIWLITSIFPMTIIDVLSGGL